MEQSKEKGQLGLYILARLGAAWRARADSIGDAERVPRLGCLLAELRKAETKLSAENLGGRCSPP